MRKTGKKYLLRLRIGSKLKELRQGYSMTQETLAEKLDVHPSYVGQLERGEREASLHTLQKLAEAFDLPPSEFIGENEATGRDELKQKCEKLLNKCSTAQLAAIHEMLASFLYRKK